MICPQCKEQGKKSCRHLPDYETYGRPGTPIPGSGFVRGYCPDCNAPIRTDDPTKPRPCMDCDGHQRPAGCGFPIDDVTGYEANAVRALEGD